VAGDSTQCARAHTYRSKLTGAGHGLATRGLLEAISRKINAISIGGGVDIGSVVGESVVVDSQAGVSGSLYCTASNAWAGQFRVADLPVSLKLFPLQEAQVCCFRIDARFSP
jgi:hypothetical protein